MSKHQKKSIFARNNKYERNIFKRIASWFRNLKGWKKAILLTFTVIVLLILGIAGYGFSKLSMIDEVKLDKEDLSCADVDGYVNILLLGVDSRNMENLEGAGADAIMILSLKEDTGEVKLLSVYRDTYMKMGKKDSYSKITDANRIGGPEMMIRSLNQAMDLNIHQFVVVNFQMVADLVDAVDGITVNVEDYEISELNKYTEETAKNIGKKNYNLVEAPGKQKLEGVQAVSYGRIRKGVGDDFKRTERMREVMSKVFKKMQTMNLRQVNRMLNKLLPQVQTNLKMKDMLIMASQLPNYKISKSISWPYLVTTGQLDGVSYVFPDDLEGNTLKLHQEMFGQMDYQPSDSVRRISRRIKADMSGINLKIPKELKELQDEETVKKEEKAEEDLKKEEQKKEEEEEPTTSPEPKPEPEPSVSPEPKPEPEQSVSPEKPESNPSDSPDQKPQPQTPQQSQTLPDQKPQKQPVEPAAQ